MFQCVKSSCASINMIGLCAKTVYNGTIGIATFKPNDLVVAFQKLNPYRIHKPARSLCSSTNHALIFSTVSRVVYSSLTNTQILLKVFCSFIVLLPYNDITKRLRTILVGVA